MGIVNGELILTNPLKPQLSAVEPTALADTGSMYLCIPDRIRWQLELEALESREVTLADGSCELVSYVGPVQIRFKNRSCFVGAVVMGERVLLGTIPMEDMDLAIIPKTQLLDVNPGNPGSAVLGPTARIRDSATTTAPPPARSSLFSSHNPPPDPYRSSRPGNTARRDGRNTTRSPPLSDTSHTTP
jgi:clan AA aspartic protease